MNRLGSRIKSVRLKQGRTQGELANHLGLKSAQYISNCERGQTIMSAHCLAIVIQFLGDKRALKKAYLDDHAARLNERLNRYS